MNKDEFINFMIDYHKSLDDAAYNEESVIDLLDLDDSFVLTLKSNFKKDGVDYITWWEYEKAGNPEIKLFDENSNEIPSESLDDLWEIVKDCIK